VKTATRMLLCLTLAGCTQSRATDPVAAAPSATAATALTTAPPAAPPNPGSTVTAPIVDEHAHSNTLETLDVLGDRVLHGAALEAPPDSDAMLTYELRLAKAGVAVPLAPDVSPALNALLLPNEQLVVVTLAGELVVTNGETLRVLDAPVARSLDVSPDGQHVAYMRGDQMPFFDLFVVNVASGERTQLTRDMIPSWSPAFSYDGSQIVFASAASGVPAVYTVARDGSGLRQHTNADVTNVGGQPSRALTPAPTGPRAPLWSPGVFVFEGEAGVVALDEAGAVLWERPGLARPRWHVRGESVAVQSRTSLGSETILSITTGNAEVSP
jgi:hypothetical protein